MKISVGVVAVSSSGGLNEDSSIHDQRHHAPEQDDAEDDGEADAAPGTTAGRFHFASPLCLRMRMNRLAITIVTASIDSPMAAA